MNVQESRVPRPCGLYLDVNGLEEVADDRVAVVAQSRVDGHQHVEGCENVELKSGCVQ